MALPDFPQVDWSALPWRNIGVGAEEKAFSGNGLSLALHRLDPQAYIPMAHAHANEQLVWMMEGTCDVVLGDEKTGERVIRMGPGSVLAIPPHVAHKSIPVGGDTIVSLDIFNPGPGGGFRLSHPELRTGALNPATTTGRRRRA
jgi:mannose-6-phosphate isomerase-like protein (cupin superfamily)